MSGQDEPFDAPKPSPLQPPGWNDPPPLDPQVSKSTRRPQLTRRVAFPLDKGSHPASEKLETDVVYTNSVQTLNIIFDKHRCPENIRRQVDNMQSNWLSPSTSDHVRKSFFEMIQHINEGRLDEALRINTQLSIDNSAMYFTLFVRTLLDFLQKKV